MTSQYYYPLSLNFRVLLIEGHGKWLVCEFDSRFYGKTR